MRLCIQHISFSIAYGDVTDARLLLLLLVRVDVLIVVFVNIFLSSFLSRSRRLLIHQRDIKEYLMNTRTLVDSSTLSWTTHGPFVTSKTFVIM